MPTATTNYDNQANQTFAKNLKGNLLLAHGTMDSNVPPDNTLLVVNELIKANKDFDLLLLPNRGHGFGNELATWCAAAGIISCATLLGARAPEAGYELKPPQAADDGGRGRLQWCPPPSLRQSPCLRREPRLDLAEDCRRKQCRTSRSASSRFGGV